MAATLAPLSMFGAHNEHWSNHPAGLPVSKYKGNTNPNTGAASVDAAYKAYQDQMTAQNPTPTTSSTPQPVGWNQWMTDWSGTPPATNTQPTTTTPTPTGTTQTPTDFSKQYTPAMMDFVYENPWTILPDVFNGISSTSPLYQALRDMGGDPLTLYNITAGSEDGSRAGGASDFINWLAQTYTGQGTAGGQRFNAQQLLQNLFGQDKFGADAKSSLGQILGAGDMSTQIRTLYNMAKDATNVGMNPLAARGYQAALAQAGDRFGEAMLGRDGTDTTTPSNPAAWMKQQYPWLAL